jgi:small ligand-binding sensory domain FIST
MLVAIVGGARAPRSNFMVDSQQMRWASAISQRIDPRQAVAEAAESVLAALGGSPDLAFLFVSTHHAAAYGAIPDWVQTFLSPRVLLGCSASGVAGAGQELERREAVSIVAARMPSVELFPFHVGANPRNADAQFWSELVGVDPARVAGLVVMVDPLSVDSEPLLRGLDTAFPRAPKVGGLVSGTQSPGDGALFLNERTHRNGALGLALCGRVELQTLVAQGCRPIGEPMIVTRSRDSIVYELNVGKPVEVLQRLFERLEPRDQELCRHSLFLGIEMRGSSHSYGQGDFLVRSLGGLEPNNGAMAVHGQIANYQVVQFHLRDARTSAQDLELRLAELQRQRTAKSARGALMFSCLGRGRELYGVPNHDSDTFIRRMGALPLGGFFGNGEIGPIGGQSFLHGYTSVFGIISEPYSPAN